MHCFMLLFLFHKLHNLLCKHLKAHMLIEAFIPLTNACPSVTLAGSNNAHVEIIAKCTTDASPMRRGPKCVLIYLFFFFFRKY